MKLQLIMLYFKRIIFLFFVFSCVTEPPPLDPCNTQFKGGDCYIQSLQKDALDIVSWSDNAIRLDYFLEDPSILIEDSINFDTPDSLIIERRMHPETEYTEFKVPYIDTTNYYIDSTVYDTGLYYYKLATQNVNGRSLYDEVTVYHSLPQIQNLSVGDIACSRIEISWEYDIENNPHESKILKLDCTKAKKRLGWHTKLNTDEAIKWTINWYKEYFKRSDMKGCTENQIDQFTSL